MYTCNYISGELKTSAFLGEVKWLSIDEAMKTLTFSHINSFIKQTYDYPNTVWGGTILRRQEGDKWTTEIIEEFYPLFSSNKKKRRKRQKRRQNLIHCVKDFLMFLIINSTYHLSLTLSSRKGDKT